MPWLSQIGLDRIEDGHLCSKFCSPNGEGAEFIDNSKKVSIGFAKVTFGPAKGIRTSIYKGECPGEGFSSTFYPARSTDNPIRRRAGLLFHD